MNRMNRRIARKSLLPRAAMTGAGLIGLGWVMHLMPEATPGRVYWPWLLITGVLVVLGVVGVWRTRRRGSAGLVNRWARKGRRNHGLASPWAILRVASALAMRRKTSVLRPACGSWDGGAGSSPPWRWPTRWPGSGCCGCGRR
jgi:type IV secretion system protein VirD4